MLLNKLKPPINKPEIAVLGGGCFWCLDAAFRKLAGALSVVSGYAGGRTKNPTYEQVSGGATGHAETVKLEYDAARLTFRELLKFFFKLHDPTALNHQGRGYGEQYRSIILYASREQQAIAEDYIKELALEKVYDDPIVTEVKPLLEFYPAEEYHQDYYSKNPQSAYCQLVISPKLDMFSWR
ncbi:MAG: peptide-methionine (S)-S-oxide reductase MsrA [bacterium]|nr:peptide-methionine (S)-S-oxide reductase MsrA [bacterium]